MKKRYSRQIILPEIGLNGQYRFENAKVLIVGAGGLGTVVSNYLVSMGIGNIGICDFDVVDETNLNRQFMFSMKDLNEQKAELLSKKLNVQNPDIKITAYPNKFDELNAKKICSGYQLICDCSDNIETRILLDKVSYDYNVPLIHGAVSGWEGYLTILNFRNKISLLDIFSERELLSSKTCINEGINATLCGVVGSYMANEAIKIIMDIDTSIDGNLLYINMLNNNFKLLKIKSVKNRN